MTVEISIWSLLATPFVMYGIVGLIEWNEKRSLAKWRKEINDRYDREDAENAKH